MVFGSTDWLKDWNEPAATVFLQEIPAYELWRWKICYLCRLWRKVGSRLAAIVKIGVEIRMYDTKTIIDYEEAGSSG